MNYHIVVDSCCDLLPEMKEEMGIYSVPLTMTLGDKSFTDNENLNLSGFLEEMHACKEKIGSAAPSPSLYKDAFQSTGAQYAVTLSSRLSSSHAFALLGKEMAEEEETQNTYVFDSKSASAGETLVTIKLFNMISEGIHKPKIITRIESFIKEMKTYFVLDNIENLVKNGRLHKIAGKIVSTLNIKPLMGSDGDGNISFFSYSRGEKQTINRLTDTIEKSGKKTDGQTLVISHCKNPSLADKLKTTLLGRYHFKDIIIVPTGGISSLYANVSGIVMAF
ncbi:MAG: DegV family protein [Clostridiales bacterium]|nr:DegV family protein [Clostridiales bacterium]